MVSLVVLLAASLLIDYAMVARRVQRVTVTLPADQPGTTWLLVGLDDRSAAGSASDDVGTGPGAAPGARTDIIIVVHERSDGQRVAWSVSRDLVLRTPERLPRRLGTFWLQGPQSLVEVMCRELRIAVDHVVAVNMRAFIALVDTLGGVDMTLPQPLRDQRAHIELDAGSHHLDGRQVLALVRSRQGEVKVDGRWVPDPEGAAGRQRRASEAMAAVASKAKDAGPLTWQRLAWRLGPDLTLDERTSLASLASLRGLPAVRTLPVRQVPNSELATRTPATQQALDASGFTQQCQP